MNHLVGTLLPHGMSKRYASVKRDIAMECAWAITEPITVNGQLKDVFAATFC